MNPEKGHQDWTLDDFRDAYRVTESDDPEPYRIQSQPLINRMNWVADHFEELGGLKEPVTLEPAEETYMNYHGIDGVDDGDELYFYSDMTADHYNELAFGGLEIAEDGDYVFLDDNTAVRLGVQYETSRPATFPEEHGPVPEKIAVRMPTYTAVMRHQCTVHHT